MPTTVVSVTLESPVGSVGVSQIVESLQALRPWGTDCSQFQSAAIVRLD